MMTAFPELGVPDRLPPNIQELKHRVYVNQEGMTMIMWNNFLYWKGSGKLIGPASILAPTIPKEYYKCDICMGSFTQKFSSKEEEESLAKHLERDHRDAVLRSMPQPKGSVGGSWIPSEDSIHKAAEKMAGVVPEVDQADPVIDQLIKPVESLTAANKKPARKWKEHGKEVVEE